jgi:hypothetical protein
MANHVYTSFNITANSEVLQDFIEKVISDEAKAKTWPENYSIMTDSLYRLLYEDYTEDSSREWMIDNIGAKWCWIHDWSADEEYIEFTMESAWSPPESFFNKLAEYLIDTGVDFELEVRSEDECHIHVSGGFANQNGYEFICIDQGYPSAPNEDDFTDDDSYYEAEEIYLAAIEDTIQDLIDECKYSLITDT